MSGGLCLRCDWRGTTQSDLCPRCGATVFTSEPSSKGARRSGGTAPGHGSPRSETPSASIGVVRRSWRHLVAIAVIVTLAIGAVALVQRYTPSPAGAADTGLHGYLLSSVADSDGVRLWIWDLAHATAIPGPVLAGLPEELVYAYLADAGWVGVTTLGDDGVRTASVIRYFGTTDRPLPVASGALVSWVTSGSFVSVVRSTPEGGCRRRVTISTWFVSIRTQERGFDDVVCGEPTAFGRNGTIAYLTLERAGVPSTWQVGSSRLFLAVPSRRLLGISRDGELLVQSSEAGSSLEMFRTSPLRNPLRPIAGRDDLLIPDSVLGWSSDREQAVVLGTYRDVHGVYLVDVGSRSSIRHLQLVLATDAVDLKVAPTADGDLYVSTNGAVSLFHDGQIRQIPAPRDAPAFVGPVLWVSTLPYSPQQP